MECCGSGGAGGKVSKEIDEKIREERETSRLKIKLLLLGTGDSGKSTFLKQMKVLHANGFSEAELERYREALRFNCLSSIQTILDAYELAQSIGKAKKRKGLTEQIDQVRAVNELTEEAAPIVQALWARKEIKEIFDRRAEFRIQVPSSSPYYFDNAARFAAEDFLPTNEDIFRVKIRTTGASDLIFETEGIEFTLVDVGGQRSERRKWLHCFDNVTSVLFLAALDEYDMVLEEDNRQNRLTESLTLFSQVSGSQFFENSSWILFLNKTDLFRDKILKAPLSGFFADSPKESDFDASLAFMTRKYVDSFRGPGQLYHYATCNIDTRATEKIFVAVRDTIISSAIRENEGKL